MKLKFYAKGDLLVTMPDVSPFVGAPPMYVGRRFVPGNGKKPASNPATESCFECDANSKAGRRLAKVCRRDGSLWPADPETAAACGVDFVPVEFRDGVWEPRVASEPQPKLKVKPSAGSKE